MAVTAGCRVVCKSILMVFSLVTLVVGLVPLALGLKISSMDKTMGERGIASLDPQFFLIEFAAVLACLGGLLVLAGLIGVYGGSSEKKWALYAFGMLAVILATAGVVFGFLAIYMKDRVGLYIVRVYVETYRLYVTNGQDGFLEFFLRIVHNLFHCCGVTGVTLVEGACPRPDHFLERIVMPNCPLTIALHFVHKSPFILFFFGIISFLWMISLCCCHILEKKQSPTAPSPQYFPLANTASPVDPGLAPGLAPGLYPGLAPPPAPTQAPPPDNPPPYAQAYVAPSGSFPLQNWSSVDFEASALKGPV